MNTCNCLGLAKSSSIFLGMPDRTGIFLGWSANLSNFLGFWGRSWGLAYVSTKNESTPLGFNPCTRDLLVKL